MAGDLAFVAPVAATLSFDGVAVVVSPLVVRDLPRLIELASPVVSTLARLDRELLARMRVKQVTPDDIGTLIAVLAADAGAIVQALAICSRQPVEWVEGLLIDRAAELLVTCVQVNADFFFRALPGLRQLAARLKPAGEPSATPTLLPS